MKTLTDLINYKFQKMNIFDDAYNFYIEFLFDQYIKGRDITVSLNEWDDCARAVILGDIFKRNSSNLNHDFGEEYFDSKFSKIVLSFYKSENFKYLPNHTVYCDESMNFRRVRLNKDTSYLLKNTFFVLGGIIVPNNVNLSFFSTLFPKHKGEFKYKFFSYDNNFPDCLSSKRFTILFEYLLNNDIKIHVNIENYLYFSLVDIIDSLPCIALDYENVLCHKSAFYHFLVKEFDDLIDLLISYDYPSIPAGKALEFINKITSLYEKSFRKNSRPGDETYQYGSQLLYLLKQTNCNELPFIQDNEPFLIEDTLMMNYIQTGVIFINNGVIFDEEQKIQNELNLLESNYLNTLNCSFINSKNNIGLQLSDVVVGFVARLLKYIFDISEDEMSNLPNTIYQNPAMKKNLSLFWEIYSRSDQFYKYSICSKMSIFDQKLVNRFFSILDSLKDI